MPINDIPDLEQTDEPLVAPKLTNEHLPAEEVENISDLGKRANNFLAGRPPVHQHHGVPPPGQPQSHLEGSDGIGSHRGQVKDPEHDHRLSSNKDKEDGDHEHETDEERRRREEEERQGKINEREKAKLERLQNTPWGQSSHTHMRPLSANFDKVVNEVIFHEAFGPEIRQTMGVKASIKGLYEVRELLHTKLASTKDVNVRRELTILQSKVANILIQAGLFKQS